MVLLAEVCWGGLPTLVWKLKIYNLETSEFASTPPFSKNSVQLGVTFGGTSQPGVTFGGNIAKNHLAGKFKKPLGENNFKK